MKEIAPNVIMIPPKEETAQEQERKRSLRVAAYCRVSTDDEEQLSSYENQRDYYTDKIMNEPTWTMVDVFADEGKTGTSTCARKNFLRMIRQCRQGKIDMILTKSVSRFARNTVDTLNFTRELRNLGIPVIFEEQNINSIRRVNFSLRSTVHLLSPKARTPVPASPGGSGRLCAPVMYSCITNGCWDMSAGRMGRP